MDKEKARRKRWNDSDKGKAAREKYDKKTYDKILIRVKKGLKDIYAEELSKDGLSLNGHMNQNILDYLEVKGYTESQLEEIHEQAKKEGL